MCNQMCVYFFQVNQPGVHLPVVYDRQFYRDIFAQYAEMLSKGRAMKTLVPYTQESGSEPEIIDPRRAKQQVSVCVIPTNTNALI